MCVFLFLCTYSCLSRVCKCVHVFCVCKDVSCVCTVYDWWTYLYARLCVMRWTWITMPVCVAFFVCSYIQMCINEIVTPLGEWNSLILLVSSLDAEERSNCLCSVWYNVTSSMWMDPHDLHQGTLWLHVICVDLVRSGRKDPEHQSYGFHLWFHFSNGEREGHLHDHRNYRHINVQHITSILWNSFIAFRDNH